MKLEAPLESMNVDISQIIHQQQNFLSFELLLPTEIPRTDTPEDEISTFRTAAWSFSRPKPRREAKALETYSSLDEAVDRILLQPLWGTAKRAQKDLVDFLVKDQQLLKVFDLMASIFLMKRGDLHQLYIGGDLPLRKVDRVFHEFIGTVPFFEYRFLDGDRVAVTIPHRLRRVIRPEHLQGYQQCYQWLARLRRMQRSLIVMNHRRAILGLRLHLVHFFVTFHQISIWQLEAALYKLDQNSRKADNLDGLSKAHADFMADLEQVYLKGYDQIATTVTNIFNFASDFCRRGAQMDGDEINAAEQQFGSFKAFLRGVLAAPAKKNPESAAASLLTALSR
jgi:hypothetical protein